MKKEDNKDRIISLLALEAADDKKTAGCPAAEELARLVDGSAGAQTSSLLHHLGSCETCYHQWLLLKRVEQGATPRSKIIRLFNRRTPKYVGSGLAIAATIALFLNITDYYDITRVAPLEKEAALENVVETDGDSSGGAAGTMSDALVEREAPAPVAELSAPAAPAPMDNSVDRSKEEFAPPQMQAVPRKAKGSVSRSLSVQSEKKIVADIVVGVSSISGDDFLLQVEKGCGMDHFDAPFWQQLLEKQPFTDAASTGQSPEGTTLSEIAGLVRDMDAASYRQRCEAVLHILAQEKKSR